MNKKEKLTTADVPTSVILGLEEVRKGGKYNMFDTQGVFNELYQLEYYEAVDWLFDENWKEGSYKSQVNTKKYVLALNLMADLVAIPQKLIN